jgi:hypothetical protein
MNEDAAGHWWLISVILATQETDQEYHSLKLAQPYLETTQYKNGWWSDSSGRVSA